MSNTVKIIKRYANRKLYDTQESCYVTLDDIGGMIRAGEDVQVLDNRSGEDLTSVTLAQIIFESEKKRNFMPLSLLRNLIQGRSDASLTEMAREGVDRVQSLMMTSQKAFDELHKNVEDRVKSGVDGAMTKYSQIGRDIDDLRKKMSELAQRVKHAGQQTSSQASQTSSQASQTSHMSDPTTRPRP